MLADELRLYAAAGGSGLVDLTPPALGRNPAGLARLATASGLHIVMGAGWYRGEYHTDDVRTQSANDLADALVREFRDGVGETGVRPGILGELGTGRGAIRASEERAFRAAARAQREVGFSISTHTTHYGELAFEQIRLLREEGVPVERIVIGHLGERRGAADVLAIAETGVYVQIDHVGRRLESGMISDEQRARNVAEVVRAGRVGQLTLSMDICANSQMHAHGGHGYDHLTRRFVPMLREAGVGEADVRTMLVDNPARGSSAFYDRRKLRRMDRQDLGRLADHDDLLRAVEAVVLDGGRLARDDHAGLEDRRVVLHDARRLRRGQADAVAQPPEPEAVSPSRALAARMARAMSATATPGLAMSTPVCVASAMRRWRSTWRAEGPPTTPARQKSDQ